MKTILIIDDSGTIGGSTIELLKCFGLRTSLASTGSIGLDLIQKKTPELVSCASQLQGLNGYAVLRTLRLDTRLDRLPFYFMLAQSTPSDRQKGMSLGATGYLTRPLSDEELLNCICRYFTLPIH